MSTHLTTKLDTLMDIVESYETDSKKLPIDRLVELHRDLFEGYRLIANDAEHVRTMDRRLDHYIRTSEVGGSTLRTTLLQLHVTGFFFRAGAPLGVSDAYNKAAEQRGKEATSETSYFRQVLVPQVLDPINTKLPARVRLELLAIIASFENETDAAAVFTDETPENELRNIPRTMFVLGLVRRWEAAARSPLTQKPNTVENRLFHTKQFEEMAREDPALRSILGPKGLGYVSLPPFWVRLAKLLRHTFEWFVALLGNLPGVITRPTLYVSIGLFWILLAVAGFAAVRKDNVRMTDRLEELKELTRQEQAEVVPPVKPLPPDDGDRELKARISEMERILRGLFESLNDDPVEFRVGADVLSAKGEGQLSMFAILYRDNLTLWRQLEILGFTDDAGAENDNQQLSQRRAESVRQYLIGRGLPGDRLVATGRGESSKFDNSTEEGRRKNRRIEFKTVWR